MKKPVWDTDRLLLFYPDNLNQKVNLSEQNLFMKFEIEASLRWEKHRRFFGKKLNHRP